MKKVVCLLWCLTAVWATSFAQLEATMPFMSSLPQVSYYNPAFKPAYKFSIGLPGSSVFAGFSNNGFTYNDFVSKQSNVLVADLDKLYAAMQDRNYVNTNVQADVFRLSMKVSARMYFTANVTAKVYNRLMLPKDLTGLFINGTSAYVNGTASLSPKIESLGYVEAGFGGSYIINKNLTLGARFKVLKGVANATTQQALFNLSLGEDYAINVSADMDVRTSGIHNLDSSEYDIEKNWRDFTRNNGMAVDLGATYRFKDRLTFGASIIDLGSITWKNDLYGYKLDPDRANFTFEGFDLQEMLNGETDDSQFDSLESKFTPEEGRIDSYRTPLPGKIYLTAVYEIRKTVTAGAMFSAERFKGRFMPAITASINKEFGRRVGTSISYTITNNSFNNLGAGLSLNFAPIQFYLAGDNLLRAPLALATGNTLNGYVNSMQYFNLRAGLNFVFGRDKTQEKQPYPKKEN
ncbi:MAG TPA: DUF5723 family protein [Chryseosolibacter sp.]|nr:DUF5723 family protein [Chryseosolibacter sp.]